MQEAIVAIEPGPQFNEENFGIPKSEEDEMEMDALKGHLSSPEMISRLSSFLEYTKTPEYKEKLQARMNRPQMKENKRQLAETMRQMGIPTPWAENLDEDKQ